jgi:hypothetical protein
MRRICSLCVAAAALVAPAFLTGCGTSGSVHVAADVPGDEAIWVDAAPPPSRVEVIGVVPGPDYVWIGGHWWWGGSRYTWAPGRWERRPYHGARWRDGQWRHHGRRWYWREGRWYR